MSYDLTIRPNKTYSEFKPIAPLVVFLEKQPHVRSNGARGYVLEEGDLWMEINIETVSDEGDNIEDDPHDIETFNCIRAHIPYPYLGQNPHRDYFPLLRSIAKQIGWQLHDEQTDDDTDEQFQDTDTPTKPWWKFWRSKDKPL
jgi:hypothetical protein